MTEWIAFWTLEPWGCEWDDSHAALIASVLVNCHKAKGKAATVKDFMIDRELVGKKQTWQEMKAIMMLYAKAMGDKKHRKERRP